MVTLHWLYQVLLCHTGFCWVMGSCWVPQIPSLELTRSPAGVHQGNDEKGLLRSLLVHLVMAFSHGWSTSFLKYVHLSRLLAYADTVTFVICPLQNNTCPRPITGKIFSWASDFFFFFQNRKHHAVSVNCIAAWLHRVRRRSCPLLAWLHIAGLSPLL